MTLTQQDDSEVLTAAALPSSRLHPFHVLPPVAATAAVLLSMHPVIDPDVYWHVRLGRDIAAGHAVDGVGQGWSLVMPEHAWTTPEWLAEVALHGLVSGVGWRGILVFQALATFAFLLLLARAVLRGSDTRVRATVYAVVAVTLASYLQARPQTWSLALIAWLAVDTRNLLGRRRLPRAWVFIPVVWLWAQLHGLWLVAPAAIALAAGLVLLDDRSPQARRLVLRGFALAGAATAVGCINPLGLRSLVLPFELRAATHTIREWHPTTFTPYFTWGLLLLLASVVVAWTRSGHVPRAEMVWVAIWTAFALGAYRNVPVAVVLISPVVADRLARPGRAALLGRREHRLVAGAVLGATALAVTALTVAAAEVRPIPLRTPVHLAQLLDDGHAHRVLNEYNTGGLVIAFGGPHSRVAIDGRADYYGGKYLDDYAAMMRMDRGWERTFNTINPDTALLLTRGALAQWLAAHGWTLVAEQGSYSLLRATTNSV